MRKGNLQVESVIESVMLDGWPTHYLVSEAESEVLQRVFGPTELGSICKTANTLSFSLSAVNLCIRSYVVIFGPERSIN